MTTPVLCAPTHGPHHAHGMCKTCHSRAYRARRRAENPPGPRRRPALELVERAERLKAELEAAGDYATTEPTWPAVAQVLGVKPATLDRYRVRARHYRAREAS